jgi:hypothetical protein
VPPLTTVFGAVTVMDGPPLGAGAEPVLTVAEVPSDAVEFAKYVVTVWPTPPGEFGFAPQVMPPKRTAAAHPTFAARASRGHGAWRRFMSVEDEFIEDDRCQRLETFMIVSFAQSSDGPGRDGTTWLFHLPHFYRRKC